MNLIPEEQKKINDFIRDYVDIYSYMNKDMIKLSHANSDEHNKRVMEICHFLFKQKIPFYTEVKLKCGTRPDIVCPTHIKKIIEVMHTETKEDFMVKKHHKYPQELRDEILFNYTNEEFNGVDLL